MQDIKERVEKEEDGQTQAQGHVSRFEPPLYIPAFLQKDFHYVHQEPTTKGSPLRNYNLKTGSAKLQLSHLNTRGKAQSQTQSKERLQLGDHKDHK